MKPSPPTTPAMASPMSKFIFQATLARLGELTDEERTQWFIDNDNFFV